MNAVDELISQLRTKSGWWEGDDNARRLLEPLVQARAAWNEREPQLYAAERRIEELTRSLSLLRDDNNRLNEMKSEQAVQS